MSRTNRTILALLSVFSVLAFGCCVFGTVWLNIGTGAGGDHYWVRACVTGDEALLIAGGDEAVSVDVSTGRVLKAVPMYVEAVVCGANGGVAYAASEDMVRFPAGERGPTNEPATMDLAGMRGDGALVHYYREHRSARGRRTTSRWPEGFARVSVSAPGTRGASIELVPALFGNLRPVSRSDAGSFITVKGDVLPDGRLLLAAGWDAGRGSGYFEPAPWGVFAVDAGTGQATAVLSPQASTAQLDSSQLSKIAASRDGTLVAATFTFLGGSTTRVAVYAGGTLRFSIDIDGAREPTALDFSTIGDRLAVATLSDDGQRAKITWIDVATGTPTWTSREIDGTVYLVRHLSDGSLVFMTSKRVVTRVGPDGIPRWQ